METWRRIALIGGFVLGTLFFFWADLGTFLLVEPVDFAKEQTEEGSYFGFPSERERYLKQLPLDKYIEEVTMDRVRAESGQEWKEFATRIADAAAGNPDDESWTRRMSPDDLDRIEPPHRYFFSEYEPPLKEIREDLDAAEGELYVTVPGEKGTHYIRVKTVTIGMGDFHLGSGLMVHPGPPTDFLYPLRRAGIVFLGLGFLLYIFLPGRRHQPGEIYFSGWRNVLGDLVGFMFFSLFFLMPFLIAGGATQALLPGFFLPLIFWPLALLGLVIIRMTLWHASLKMLLTDRHLAIRTDSGDFDISFETIHSWGPAFLAPPKWLIALTWVSAFASRGSAQYGALGRASILSGTSYGGLAIRLMDGRSIYLWITDQIGNITLKGAERIPQALQEAEIPQFEDPVEIRSIGAPITDDPEWKKRSRRAVLGLAMAIALPFVALGFLIAATSLSSVFTGMSSSSSSEESQADALLLGDLTGIVAWEQIYQDCDMCITGYGQHIVDLPDGGYLLTGTTMPSGNNVQILLLRVTETGNLTWAKAVGTELWDYANAVITLKDGNFLLAGVSKPYSSYLGESQAYVLKIDPEGTVLWEQTYGEEERSETILAAKEDPDGTLRFLGKTDEGVFVLTTRADGTSGDLKDLSGVPANPGDTIREARFLPDGGAVLAGDSEQPGAGFVDALLIRLNSKGNIAWTSTYGTPKKDVFYGVEPLEDGGFAAVGLTESTGETDGCLYVVKIDNKGGILWNLAHKPARSVSGIDLTVRENGDLVVLGQLPTDGQRHPSLRITEVSGEGAVIWDEPFSRLTRTYYPSMILGRPDAVLVTGQVMEDDFGWGRVFFAEMRHLQP
ncbi:MAG TPA: hypothetical protein PK014_10715 [Thermoanaerobaculia bacterium]|nr:hypothetical protein [Thermoanaerobaculia bacterium]HUM30595.1 hypothetical protein [Thermoanaerobaculia bacterium]HXK68877.1 hypothetical protein [Thermoanaerobaculia bacterium]